MMRFLKPLGLTFLTFFISTIASYAQQDIIQAINSYGTFDKWCSREVKESDLPAWLLQIKNEFEPELLQKLNAFVNGDKDKVLEYYESDEVGFEYDNDGEGGSFKLMLSKED